VRKLYLVNDVGTMTYSLKRVIIFFLNKSKWDILPTPKVA